MLAKYPNKRNVIEFVSLEAMVPEDHLLRKIDAAIDFDRIYDFVEDLYCEDNGRPSIDPVILFKIVLISTHLWTAISSPNSGRDQYEHGLSLVFGHPHQ